MFSSREWWLQAFALAATVMTSVGATAAPMGFKDSTMMMLDVGRDERSVSANHALTSQDAIGVSWQDMRMHTTHHGNTYHGWQHVRQLTYTRRAQRWNMPDAQANVWLFAAVGEVKRHMGAGQVTQTVVTPGFQVDAESTRLYTSLSGQFHHANGFHQRTLAVRAGFSFYETSYEEWQPWFIVEAKRTSGITQGVEWTPMLRLIHKRYFLELGVSESGQARLSAMFNF